MPENGSQAAARVAAAPVLDDSARSIVQLAADVRYSAASRDSLRFRGRPQARAAPYFLDTGKLPAFGSTLVGAEGLVASGPVSLTSAGVRIWLPQAGFTDRFDGAYVAASWFPRGENRRFDRARGTFDGVDMRSHMNAFELAMQYTWTSVQTSHVDGGVLHEATAGLSWYRDRGLRVELNAGGAHLDRKGLRSWTPMTLARLQWKVS